MVDANHEMMGAQDNGSNFVSINMIKTSLYFKIVAVKYVNKVPRCVSGYEI